MIDLLSAVSSASGRSLRKATERRVPTAKLRKPLSTFRVNILLVERKRDAARSVPNVPEKLKINTQSKSMARSLSDFVVRLPCK